MICFVGVSKAYLASYAFFPHCNSATMQAFLAWVCMLLYQGLSDWLFGV